MQWIMKWKFYGAENDCNPIHILREDVSKLLDQCLVEIEKYGIKPQRNLVTQLKQWAWQSSSWENDRKGCAIFPYKF